ncbi:hypothetical protein AB0O31_11035 [Kitasatospora cineracea]|uniref:hypothetical protein n=1 Tax=Kitasatospora cineracea TaxID=88074 RepID=UPI0034161C80
MSLSLRLRRASAAGALLAAALFATACEPTDQVAPASVAPSHSSSAPAPSPSPTPTPTPTPTPEPAQTPEATPTPTPEPTAAATTQPPKTAATKPATTPTAARTTSKPPAEPAHTQQAAGCHPLSNAGNCYKAGQFCRAGDHGVSGTDATGRTIVCVDKNGWRWIAS